MVDLDTQCLESLCQFFLLDFLVDKWLNHLAEIASSNYWLLGSLSHYGRCHSSGLLKFSIDCQYLANLCLVSLSEYVSCRLPCPCVHSHVQGSIEAEGKPTFGIIEVMTRNAQIGKQSVNLINTMIPHPVFQISEIASDEGE